MNRVLLDTSAYIQLTRGSPDMAAEIRKADEVFLNTAVLGELGASFLTGTQRAFNQRKLSEFLQSPRTAVLSIDAATSDHYANIVAALRSAGTPIPINDVWIAASALQHRLRVLTFDAHFKHIARLQVTHLGS